MKSGTPVHILLIALVLLFVNPGESRPQTDDGKQSLAAQRTPPVIRVSSNLVTVPVSVTDSAGNPIRNLKIRDFAIEENGRPEALTGVVEPGQTPLELALLLDVSGSIQPRFDFEVQAAARFMQMVLQPEDTFAIFSIGPQPGLVHSSTSNVEEGVRSLGALVATRGSTAFYDSVVFAAQFLGRKRVPGSRRVVVVISDGEDNNSESYHLSETLQEVQRADCIFYSINPSGSSIRLNQVSLNGQEGLDLLARQTGGRAYVPEHADELDSIFNKITSELRAQYVLEYYSSDQRRDGIYREIAVKLPNYPALRVHARHGYYAATG